MKHLKIFESDNNQYRYDVDDSNMFEIEDYNIVVQLVKEDLVAIKEILNKKYNTYYSDNIEIYIFENILTILYIEEKEQLNIYSFEFPNLLKNIKKYINNVATFKEVSYEEFKPTKTIIEDYIRYANKYNL